MGKQFTKILMDGFYVKVSDTHPAGYIIAVFFLSSFFIENMEAKNRIFNYSQKDKQNE